MPSFAPKKKGRYTVTNTLDNPAVVTCQQDSFHRNLQMRLVASRKNCQHYIDHRYTNNTNYCTSSEVRLT